MARIIVVDDEADIRSLVRECLALDGHAVDEAASAQDLRAMLAVASVDLVVLDVNMPKESGLAVARNLRERYDVAILMLSGAAHVVDRVVGLEIGADDYLPKPFEPAELVARVQALLRRRDLKTDHVHFGPYRFDLQRFLLLDTNGRPLRLSETELDLVAAFATRPGQVLDRETLLRLAPPQGDDPNDRSIDNRVTRLRRKLERHPDRPELIKTVRGGGYVHPMRVQD